MAYNYQKQIHIVGFDVEHVGLSEDDTVWHMEDQCELGAFMAEYMEGCDEVEDTPLTDLEKKRLLDFVTWAYHRK